MRPFMLSRSFRDVVVRSNSSRTVQKRPLYFLFTHVLIYREAGIRAHNQAAHDIDFFF